MQFRSHFSVTLCALFGAIVVTGCSRQPSPAAIDLAVSDNASRAGMPVQGAKAQVSPARDAADPVSGASPSGPSPESGEPRFQRYRVVDAKSGGMVVASIEVPDGWRTASQIDWDLTSATNPAHAHLRFDAPDGSAWFEGYPMEVFFWLSVPNPQPLGTRASGQINYPNIGIEEAMRRFVIARYRGDRKNLQIVATRPVANLARTLAGQDVQGDSTVVRVRYEQDGHAVDEDFYGFLAAKESIPYDGPQGRTWEFHRGLYLVHSLGASDGHLQEAYPALTHIAASIQPNPLWQQHRQQVITRIVQAFNQQSARNYAGIAAAGRRSAAISAGNDAMIAGMDARRAASNARSTLQGSNGEGFNFDDMIRGTERMNDPYSGVSEQSTNQSHHWTDGNGNYQHSNDAGFNPNVGATQNWTEMTPVGK